jgi:hypothetical protein
MADTQSDQIKVRCPCGVKIRVPAAAAGRKAKCPQCSAVFLIPGTRDATAATPAPKAAASKPRPPAPPASHSSPDDDDFMLDELAAMSASAEAVDTGERPGGIARCAKCGTVMQGGAVMCIACGYNVATGKSAKVASTKPPKSAAVAKVAMGLGGYLAGTILSVVGAGIGLVIWIVVAMFLGAESGWVAWGIGGLAGVGMLIGYRKESVQGGVTAAGVATAAIVGAKFAVFAVVVIGSGLLEARIVERLALTAHYATLQAREEGLAFNSSEYDDVLVDQGERVGEMTTEEIDQAIAEVKEWKENRWYNEQYVRDFLVYAEIDNLGAGVELDLPEEDGGPSPAQWDEWYKAATEKVDQMSTKERVQLAKRTSTEHTSFDAEMMDEVLANSEEGGEVATAGAGSFISMFSAWDILWFLLAISSAYKLGSGGGAVKVAS